MLFRFKRRTASVPLPWCARQAPQVSDRSDCESSCTSALTAERRKGQIMEHYDMIKSGARIRECRKASGLTQEKLAEMVGVDRSSIGRIEAGVNGCSVDMFVQLSTVLDTSLDHLIMGKKLNPKLLKKEIRDVVDQLLELQNCLDM